MKRIATAVLLLGALGSGSALAGHSYYGVSYGVFIGPPVFGPWWWYPPAPFYYGPPVIYRQSVIVEQRPRMVVQSTPSYPAPTEPAIGSVIELGPVDRAKPAGPNPTPKAPQANASQSLSHSEGAMTRGGQLYIYPRQAQSAQQQARDEAECDRWAASQMGSGFDATQAAAHFQRALAACLDAHGYSVK